MAKKETVIVFDGEDKFIAPKERTFDKEKGVSNFVGQDGSVSSQPTGAVPKMNPDGTVATQLSPEAQRFTDYMANQGTPVQIPTPSSPNFCVEIKTFIETRGGGKATSEMVMDAYSAFQQFCVEKPVEKKPVLTEPSVPIDSPPPIPKPVEEVKPAPVEVKLPTNISLSTPALGRPPMMGGGAGGGGGEEEPKPEEKKKTNWLFWLLVGGVGLYLFTRKKS